MPSGAEDKPESEEKDVNPSVKKENSGEKKAITNENSEEKKGVTKEKSEEEKGNLKPVDPKDHGTDDQSKEDYGEHVSARLNYLRRAYNGTGAKASQKPAGKVKIR